MKTLFLCGILLICMSAAAVSQVPTHAPTASDSGMVFTSPRAEKPAPADSQEAEQRHAWGIDVMLSGNGFGLGGFYRHEYTRDFFGTVSLAISDSKDDNEVEYYDYWSGQNYVPNKLNRFLMMPLYFGAQYRLFADDITDTFRPYINAGAGPTLILSSPYEREFFNALHYARAHYTAGGYVGLGAFFGSEKGSLMGVNFRYYYIPVPGGLESMINPLDNSITKKRDFGGFFITVNIGSSY